MSIADKHIVFGGAGGWGVSTPWGTLGEITSRVLELHGYDLWIQREAWGPNNPRYVGEGLVDFGATQLRAIQHAYNGTGLYADVEPRKNLRVIACVNHPGWIAVAVRAETGITDLAQIKERKYPIRVLNRAPGSVQRLIFDRYGLSQEAVESWGGKFLAGGEGVAGVSAQTSGWVRSGDFDLIVSYIYTSYTLEIRHWHEATILYNMRFLELPGDLNEAIGKEIGGSVGFIPHHLFRGIEENIPAPRRGLQAIYGRDDMPDDFVRFLAQAYDDGRDHFRQVHLPYSYDPANVGASKDVPLHPAVEAYYREKGYLS